MALEADLTPYELRVKRNIEENQRVLKSLGLLNYNIDRKDIKKTARRNNVAAKRRESVKSNDDPVFSPSHPVRRTRRSSSLFKTCLEESDGTPDNLDEEYNPPSKIKRTAPECVFGPIPGVRVGDWWQTRMDCSRAGVHRATVAGICGKSGEGCTSIALSGGYEDDIDCGEYFTYTGSGGRDLKGTKAKPKNLRTAPQSKDQVLEGVNAHLALNVENHRPVRVIRGYKLPGPYAPEEGYRYDGLYSVEKCWTATGVAGFKVYKYALKRLADQDPPPWETNETVIPDQNGHNETTDESPEENVSEDDSHKPSSTTGPNPFPVSNDSPTSEQNSNPHTASEVKSSSIVSEYKDYEQESSPNTSPLQQNLEIEPENLNQIQKLRTRKSSVINSPDNVTTKVTNSTRKRKREAINGNIEIDTVTNKSPYTTKQNVSVKESKIDENASEDDSHKPSSTTGPNLFLVSNNSSNSEQNFNHDTASEVKSSSIVSESKDYEQESSPPQQNLEIEPENLNQIQKLRTRKSSVINSPDNVTTKVTNSTRKRKREAINGNIEINTVTNKSPPTTKQNFLVKESKIDENVSEDDSHKPSSTTGPNPFLVSNNSPNSEQNSNPDTASEVKSSSIVNESKDHEQESSPSNIPSLPKQNLEIEPENLAQKQKLKTRKSSVINSPDSVDTKMANSKSVTNSRTGKSKGEDSNDNTKINTVTNKSPPTSKRNVSVKESKIDESNQMSAKKMKTGLRSKKNLAEGKISHESLLYNQAALGGKEISGDNVSVTIEPPSSSTLDDSEATVKGFNNNALSSKDHITMNGELSNSNQVKSFSPKSKSSSECSISATNKSDEALQTALEVSSHTLNSLGGLQEELHLETSQRDISSQKCNKTACDSAKSPQVFVKENGDGICKKPEFCASCKLSLSKPEFCACCKRSLSLETTESELKDQSNNLNSDGKRQTLILKYFGPVEKAKGQQTSSSGISLRGNRHSFMNYTCKIDSNTIKDIVSKDHCQSPQNKNKRKRKHPTRKSTKLNTSGRNVPTESEILKSSPVKPCSVILVRISPVSNNKTVLKSVEKSPALKKVNTNPFHSKLTCWDSDEEEEFLGFDCDEEPHLLFYGFE
ncbi:uncharacterized protein LOC129003074 [Macrosteles quadrilineatus]|uniref:uncharacterized protein LOC129003074 n=1 Tax=Macrosteles quadrilineatus TaxID=74068 RepID=UPI0023E29675|nr:uncharacterized protein LOC129003074 [Macrosteles quadrilineatus]